MKKAISVLSGGLDCTVATSVYAKDYEIHAITFNYGQKAFKQELKAAKEICEKMGFTHTVIDLPWLAEISNSSLNTSEDIPEVDLDDLDDLKKSTETANSVWVPARNTVFTSIAASFAESIGAEKLVAITLVHFQRLISKFSIDIPVCSCGMTNSIDSINTVCQPNRPAAIIMHCHFTS